jgi:signal transduction histidine kinase
MLVCRAVGSGEEPPSTPKRILLLYHYGRETAGVALLDRGFEEVLRSAPPFTIELNREVLENYRFPGEAHTQMMRNYLKEKYSGRKIDVVVAHTDTALKFFLQYRDELFPGVPVVYIISKRPEPGSEPALSTGIWTGLNVRETLELALQLQPTTTQVFLISGSADNQAVEVETQQQLKQFEGRVRLNYISGRPIDEVIVSVKTLPPNSIIIFQRLNQGVAGRGITPREAVALISQAANAPVYSTLDSNVGEGVIGGMVMTHDDMGRRAARMAMKIVQGANPEQIPVETNIIVPMFDWRQLRRWGIRESSLPAGSVVLFKEWSFWELYRWRIVIALTVLTVQSILIAILLVQRSKRAKAEALRQISERNLQRLTGQLIHVQDEERRRVARELHDGLGQTLSIINNRATICMNSLNDQDCLREQLGEISEVTFAGLDEVREIAHNLRPYELDRLGLVQAIESMIEKVSNSTSIQISSSVDSIDGLLSSDAETGIYRILQEGLNNVLKHASASETRVSIRRKGDELEVNLADNGKGFDQRAQGNGRGKGFGLAGITERARMLRATCTIDSSLGRGTTLSIRIPLARDLDGK